MQKLKWFGAEFLVVLTGVLVALGAQAWWQHRQDRGRESAYLEQLLSDTRENELRLDTAIVQDSTYAENFTRLLRMLRSPAALPPIDTIQKYFPSRAASFTAITGTYEALILAGDINLIRDDSLRIRIIRYASEIRQSDDALDRYVDAGWSFLDARTQREEVFARLPRNEEELGAPRIALIDLERLRRDPGTIASIRMMQTVITAHRRRLQTLQTSTRSLRELLEAQQR